MKKTLKLLVAASLLGTSTLASAQSAQSLSVARAVAPTQRESNLAGGETAMGFIIIVVVIALAVLATETLGQRNPRTP